MARTKKNIIVELDDIDQAQIDNKLVDLQNQFNSHIK